MRSAGLVLAAALSLVPGVGGAQSAGQEVEALVGRLSEAEAVQTAELLGMCGGVYSAFAVFSETRMPERSREYKAMGNGALTAGAYLLYREHRHRTREVRPVSDFMPQVRGRAETAAAETLAAFSAEDFDTPQEKLSACFKMVELQDFLVAAMQDEFARR